MKSKDEKEVEKIINERFPEDKSIMGSVVFWLLIGLFGLAGITRITGHQELLFKHIEWFGILFGVAGGYWKIRDYQRGFMNYKLRRRTYIIYKKERPILFCFLWAFQIFCCLGIVSICLYAIITGEPANT